MMKREFPGAPIVGVGAVIIDDERRVLVVRRGQEPLQGQWSLPGGALELGESLTDGVRREVEEETGLTVEPLEILEVFDHIAHMEDSKRVRFHYVLIDYWCRVTGGVLACGSDATEARWARPEELKLGGRYPVLPFTLSVIEKGLELHSRACFTSDSESR
jgi:8-oxo-dGTP diphosphatase